MKFTKQSVRDLNEKPRNGHRYKSVFWSRPRHEWVAAEDLLGRVLWHRCARCGARDLGFNMAGEFCR